MCMPRTLVVVEVVQCVIEASNLCANQVFRVAKHF